MLVNAHNFPGPALWQGIMLIVAVCWVAFVLTGKPVSQRAMRWSLAGICAFGLALMVAIIAVYKP